MKLLREKFKTAEGAWKRCRFENGVAKSEYQQGYKSKHYRYTVHEQDGVYRVARLQPRQHKHVGVGYCPHCDHYGDNCTGAR